MAYDPSADIQYQPSNPQGSYMTPETLKNLREYAMALQAKSASQGGGQQQPILAAGSAYFSPWQGVSNMANALVGGYDAYKANQAERGAGVAHDRTFWNNTQPLPGSSDDASSNEPATQEGASTKLASAGGSIDPEILKKVTGQMESGGRYDNVTTTVGRDGRPQHALGKYGVMDKNVPEWTKDILGQPMSPQEFLHNPIAQDLVYKAKMAEYTSKYGVEGAGRAWLGGEGGVNHPERRDPLGTSVGGYGREFASRVAAQNGLDPAGLAASPPVRVAQNGPVTAAARGGAPTSMPPSQIPMQQVPGGASSTFQPVQIPRGLIPPPSRFTPQTMTDITSSQFGNPALNALAVQQYYGTQINPRTLGAPGGSIVVPPGQQSQGYFVPEIQQGNIKLRGGTEFPAPYTINPFGPNGIQTSPIPRAPVPGPQSENTPAPQEPQGTPPPAVGAPGEVPGRGVGEIQTPTRVAALGDIQIPPQAAGGAETKLPGMPPAMPGAPAGPAPTAVAGNAPPSSVVNPPPTIPPPPTPTQGEPATAPAKGFPGAPSLIPPDIWNADVALQKADAAKAALQSQMTASGDQYAKRYETLVNAGNGSLAQLPQLEAARDLVTNPNTAQGLFAAPKQFAQRALDAMGYSSGTSAPTQVFQKIVANSILEGLRAFTQGASVGQIRTAEISLARLASASIDNDPHANMALLNIAIRMHQQNAAIANMAAEYSNTHSGLDSGFDKQLLEWRKANPVLKPEDYKLITDIGDKAAKAPSPEGAPKVMKIEDAVEALKKDPSVANKKFFTDTYHVSPDQFLPAK